MRDLAKIIDLGALTEDRVFEDASVNTCIGADGDMILKNDPAKMGSITLAVRRSKHAETGFSDTGPRQQRHMIANQCAEHAGICSDLTVPAYLNARTDRDIGADPSAFAYDGAGPDNRPWRNTRILMHLGIRRDTGITRPVQMTRPVHRQRCDGMGVAGQWHDQFCRAFRHIFQVGFVRHEDPGIYRNLGSRLSIAIQEGKIARLGICGRGDTRHTQVAIPIKRRAGQFRYLAKRQSPQWRIEPRIDRHDMLRYCGLAG